MSCIAARLPDLFTDSTDLDLLLISKCGNRFVTPIVETLLNGSDALPAASVDRLAALIVLEYGEAWNRIKDALTVEYNPLYNGLYHETVEQHQEGETGDTSSEENKSDVSAINTVPGSYTSDDKTTTSTEASGTSRNSMARTTERQTSGSQYRNADVLQAEIQMRINSRFTAQVIDDVKNYIAMQIY